MNSIISLFLVCVILIVLPIMSSVMKRKRFEASMKRYLDERTLREREMQYSGVKRQDSTPNYNNKKTSSLNDKISSVDDRPKKKRRLFKEPSWDDE